jgi:preprotein translocase subunit SecA
MTGTAKTAEAEFEKIYNRKVTVIPTARKMIRNDLPDLVYRDEFSKWKAIAKETYDLYKVGRPILIGTTSIEKSNIISELLKDLGVKHRLLNAKPENINFESEIIAQAGRKNAVTVATNMAGRGTDILLGGNADFQTKEQIFMFINELKTKNFYLLENKNILNLLKNKLVSKKGTNLLIAKKLETQIIFQKILIQYKKLNIPYSEFITSSQIIKYLNKNEIQNVIIKIVENNYLNIQNPIDIYLKVLYDYYYKKNQQNCLTEKQIVQKLGGLYVIGTELHESRRIDNQLRGRAGRQGDPGTSRFMISLEDNLFRIFVGDEIRKIMTQLQIDDDTPLQSGILSTVLENVQKKVENYYYDMRKRIFDYDEIINFQRISIYRERRALLKSKSIRREMIAYGEYLLSGLARELKKFELKNEKTNFYQLNKEISYLLGISYIFLNYEEVKSKNIEEITYLLIQQFWLSYDLKEAEFESFIPSLIRLLEKSSLLKEIDIGWKTHLQKAEILKETIGWRGYGQLDPLLEYKTEAFNLFLETNRQIKYNSIYNILKTQLKTNF